MIRATNLIKHMGWEILGQLESYHWQPVYVFVEDTTMLYFDPEFPTFEMMFKKTCNYTTIRETYETV